MERPGARSRPPRAVYDDHASAREEPHRRGVESALRVRRPGKRNLTSERRLRGGQCGYVIALKGLICASGTATRPNQPDLRRRPADRRAAAHAPAAADRAPSHRSRGRYRAHPPRALAFTLAPPEAKEPPPACRTSPAASASPSDRSPSAPPSAPRTTSSAPRTVTLPSGPSSAYPSCSPPSSSEPSRPPPPSPQPRQSARPRSPAAHNRPRSHRQTAVESPVPCFVPGRLPA
jgi:hypothetical protein